MKSCLILFCCLLTTLDCRSQNIIFKGRIKCNNQNENSTKGAENVVIVPTFKPSASTITGSQPTGYFEFNTGVSISRLQDKTVSLYALSRCSICKESARRIFVSEDQDRQNRNDNKLYVTIKDWLLNANCTTAELRPRAADSVLKVVLKQPDLDLEHVSDASAVVSAPTVLNFLAKLATVVSATGFPGGGLKNLDLGPGRIKSGESFLASPMIYSGNIGFNFAPNRDRSEAVFWNPSSMNLEGNRLQANLFSNLRNNLKIGLIYSIDEKITVGVGFIGTRQFENRTTEFFDDNQDTHFRNDDGLDTIAIKHNEYVFQCSAGMKINDRLHVGVGIKRMSQQFNFPDSIFIPDNGKNIQFIDKRFEQVAYDIDLSASYKLFNSLQVGINLMNISGSILKGKVSRKAGIDSIPVLQQRSMGFGVIYKNKRWNLGTDLLFNGSGLYDMSVGASYVPFNHALLSAGVALKRGSYSISFRLKHFRIAYINDAGWLVDERLKSNTDILHGHIYGGFVYGFK